MLKTSRPLPLLVGILSSALLFLPVKAVAGLIEYALILALIAILTISALKPSDPATVAAVLQDLATAEAALQQDLAALSNPASAHVAGELEAYFNLKHGLQEAIAEVQVTEIQITKVFDKGLAKL